MKQLFIVFLLLLGTCIYATFWAYSTAMSGYLIIGLAICCPVTFIMMTGSYHLMKKES